MKNKLVSIVALAIILFCVSCFDVARSDQARIIAYQKYDEYVVEIGLRREALIMQVPQAKKGSTIFEWIGYVDESSKKGKVGIRIIVDDKKSKSVEIVQLGLSGDWVLFLRRHDRK